MARLAADGACMSCSAAPSRDGRVLIRAPSSRTCRLVSSTQMVTFLPASAGPSQTCCPPAHRLPDGGTTRPVSSASSDASWSAAAPGRSAGDRSCRPDCGMLAAVASWGGTRSGSGDAAGVNREAGKAMSRDWCGRSAL
jgi:hypothetical protein